jgi:hypothetical protein
MKILKNKLMFLFKIFFPVKYKLYIQRKELENINKFAMNSCSSFINKKNKTKIDNIGKSLTFYLKKKKTGRVIVVKGSSFKDVKDQYGKEYDFFEPMIKNSNDEWDFSGKLISNQDNIQDHQIMKLFNKIIKTIFNKIIKTR